jgi:hypothetical protein
MRICERLSSRGPWDAKVPSTLEINNRFPILSGFDFRESSNRFSQSAGHFSLRPPNSLTSFLERLRELHAISSCNRVRPGSEIITSLPREHACKMLS